MNYNANQITRLTNQFLDFCTIKPKSKLSDGVFPLSARHLHFYNSSNLPIHCLVRLLKSKEVHLINQLHHLFESIFFAKIGFKVTHIACLQSARLLEI